MIIYHSTVSLFHMHGQFLAVLDRIWHVAFLYPPNSHVPVSEHRLHLQDRAPRAVYICHCKWVASYVGPFGTSGRQVQQTVRRRRENWAPQMRGVTKPHRWKGAPLVWYIHIITSLAWYSHAHTSSIVSNVIMSQHDHVIQKQYTLKGWPNFSTGFSSNMKNSTVLVQIQF